MATASRLADAMASLSMPFCILQQPGSATSPPSTLVTTTAIATSAARVELVCLSTLVMLVTAERIRLSTSRTLRAIDRPINFWLLLHIFISFFEVGRLQWRALGGFPVHPTVFDLALGMAHCLSSYQVLLLRTRAGYKDQIPLGLRLQPFFFRIVATLIAFPLNSPALHRANIRLGFDSFLYARLCIFSYSKLSPIRFGTRTVSTYASILGGFVATYASGIKYGSFAYVVCSAISLLLDRRTAQFMASLSNTAGCHARACKRASIIMAPVTEDVSTIVESYSRGALRHEIESARKPWRTMTHAPPEVI